MHDVQGFGGRCLNVRQPATLITQAPFPASTSPDTDSRQRPLACKAPFGVLFLSGSFTGRDAKSGKVPLSVVFANQLNYMNNKFVHFCGIA
jgi:hypothetical protein